MELSAWELRGFLAYPQQYGKPKPGTQEEIRWSKGWIKAQAQSNNPLGDEWAFGRDTYFAHYDD